MKEALYILSDVVHHLQKERGCAAVHLCSEGKCFADRLRPQFEVSDNAVKALREGLGRWDVAGGLKKPHVKKLQKILNCWDDLQLLREKIVAQTVSPSDAIDHYAQELISPLLQSMIEIALFIENHNPVFVSAYNAFLQWKERVGLERAISLRGFVDKGFENKDFLEQLLFVLSEQGNYRDTFLALSSPAQRTLIETVLQGETSARLHHLQKQLCDSPESAELATLTPEYWFNLVSVKMEALRGVEAQLIDTLSLDYEPDDVGITSEPSSFGEYDDLIGTLQLFSGLTPMHVDGLLKHAQIRDFQRGKLLFLEGEQGNRLYIILKGWVKVFKGTADGDEAVLQMLSSGDSIMESAIFLGTTFPASAQVAEDVTLLSIPAPVIREQMKHNNDLALNLLMSMSYRSQGLIRQIESGRLKTVDERIGWFLLRLLLEQGSLSRSVELPYSKSLIASYLDMKRETFSRSLKRLKEKGFKVENDMVVIPDLRSLCGFCDHDTAMQCGAHGTVECPNPQHEESKSSACV